MKDLNAFYQELKTASALTAGFAAAVKGGTIESFLKANEVDATAEEFMALANGEMTDAQLDAVAGGASFSEAMLSVFTAGIGCAVMAIGSAVGEGVGNGKDGTLLCNNDEWHDTLYGY